MDYLDRKQVHNLVRTVALFCILAVFACFQLSAAKSPSYGDPLDLPGAEAAADPSVIRVNDTYYLYPTSSWDRIECWSSEDFGSWTYEGAVWGPADEGSWNDQGLWAPDVLPYEGHYYLYYTANQRIGVAVADSPTGPFEDVYDHPFIGGEYPKLSSTYCFKYACGVSNRLPCLSGALNGSLTKTHE